MSKIDKIGSVHLLKITLIVKNLLGYAETDSLFSVAEKLLRDLILKKTIC